jgi:hypothetical protein
MRRIMNSISWVSDKLWIYATVDDVRFNDLAHCVKRVTPAECRHFREAMNTALRVRLALA